MSVDQARVDSIKFKTYRPTRKTPEAGDRKIIRGVMHVRCYSMAQQYGNASPYLRTVTRGKPNYEWVRESEADLNSFMRKHCVEHNRRLKIRWEEREC